MRDGFGSLHHASPAAKGEAVLTCGDEAPEPGRSPYPYSAQAFLLRTGVVRFGKPTQFVAVGSLGPRSCSAFAQSLRRG